MGKHVYTIIKRYLPSYLIFFGLLHAVIAMVAVFGKYILPDVILDVPDVSLFLLLAFACFTVLVSEKHKEYPPVIFPDLRKIEFLLLIAFFLITAINTLWAWTVRGGSPRNDFALLYFAATSIFGLYPLGTYLGRSKKDLCFRRLMRALTWGICVLIIFGIIWVFVGPHTAKVSEYFHMYKDRLYLNTNPNMSGMFFCLLLMMLPYTFHGLDRGKKIFSIVLAGSILLIGLLFTDCRGAIVASFVGASLACGIYLWEKNGHLSLLKRLFIIIAAVGAICVILLVGRGLFRPIITSLPDGVMVEHKSPYSVGTMVRGSNRAVALSSNRTNAIVRPLQNRANASIVDSGGNGRIAIWKCVFQSLKNNPTYLLRGCGLVEIPHALMENGSLTTSYSHTHNQFLEILLGLGLPALLLFIGWLLLLCEKCLQLGLDPDHSWAQRILPVVILSMLICNMFEPRLLFVRWIVGDIFFLLAGYVFGLMEERKSAEKVEHLSI